MKREEKNGVHSKDLSRNNSFEVYYGDSPVGVPFRWESRPGTPRIKSRRETRLPPLTPPPSYLSSPARENTAKKQRKVNLLLHSFLPKLSVKKSQFQSLPTSSSSPSSSSSSSSSSSPWSRSYSAPGSPCALNSNVQARKRVDDDDDDDDYESAVSSPCFCVGRRAKAGSRGLSSNMLKLLFGEFA